MTLREHLKAIRDRHAVLVRHGSTDVLTWQQAVAALAILKDADEHLHEIASDISWNVCHGATVPGYVMVESHLEAARTLLGLVPDAEGSA